MNEKWDRRFLDLAAYIGRWSKDGSTQVGAVLVDTDRRIVSCAFNGFPRGVDDDQARYLDRELKYRLVVHAEANALLFARRDLTGCTLYTHPFAPCSTCAGLVIQAGITRCVAPMPDSALQERWGASLATAALLFREASVTITLVETVSA